MGVRLAHGVLQSTNFISHRWKVASGKMEITVRVVSCLLGTCFVIDCVPVKAKYWSMTEKRWKYFWHRKLSLGYLLDFFCDSMWMQTALPPIKKKDILVWLLCLTQLMHFKLSCVSVFLFLPTVNDKLSFSVTTSHVLYVLAQDIKKTSTELRTTT